MTDARSPLHSDTNRRQTYAEKVDYVGLSNNDNYTRLPRVQRPDISSIRNIRCDYIHNDITSSRDKFRVTATWW